MRICDVRGDCRTSKLYGAVKELPDIEVGPVHYVSGPGDGSDRPFDDVGVEMMRPNLIRTDAGTGAVQVRSQGSLRPTRTNRNTI
jgi:hypothetical protein